MSPPSLLCGEDRFCHPRARGSDYTNYKSGKNRPNGFPPKYFTKNSPDLRLVVPSGCEETCRPDSSPQPRLSPSPISNIDRFLQSTTPTVPVQYLSKATTKCPTDCGPDFRPYFVLADLWDAYTEWSFYGAGAPLVRGHDHIVQYYVPSLSGIQLYAESSRHATELSKPAEESDAEFAKDSSSDVSSDSEFDGWSHSSDASGSRSAQGSSLRDKTDGFSSDDSESYAQEQLLFEYFEQERPHDRVPFADKISELACQYSKLRTLKTCELLPSSWVSVAWYPIYRIPAGPTVKDLEACFLTFHRLSMPGGSSVVGQSVRNDSVSKIPFPAIGMTACKLYDSTWSVNGGFNRMRPLQQEADKLIKQLQVIHPDWQYFVNRR